MLCTTESNPTKTREFKGGIWDGFQLEAGVAPQFIKQQDAMHRNPEAPELVKTFLLTDANGTKYQIFEPEDVDDIDIIQSSYN